MAEVNLLRELLVLKVEEKLLKVTAMKRIISIIAAILLFAAPMAVAQNYNVWITSEGAGLQISGGSGYRCPPPPPRYDRHHHKNYKKHHKKIKKREKELRKARKKYIKAQRKYYEERYYPYRRHHDDDDD